MTAQALSLLLADFEADVLLKRNALFLQKLGDGAFELAGVEEVLIKEGLLLEERVELSFRDLLGDVLGLARRLCLLDGDFAALWRRALG